MKPFKVLLKLLAVQKCSAWGLFFFLLSMHSGKQESSLRSSPTVNPIQALRVLGSGGVEMSGRIGSYSVLLFWVAQQQNPEIEMLHSHRSAEGGHPEGRNLTNKGGLFQRHL